MAHSYNLTSACNLHCTGCWAAEYGHKLNLTFDELDNIVTQGKELGVYFYMMTGGEPLVRKADIIRLCEKHNDCAFHCYTNGTLVDEKLCEDMKRVGNLSFPFPLRDLKMPTISDVEKVYTIKSFTQWICYMRTD